MNQASQNLIGMRLDQYQIERRLGQGAMGEVYEARHSVIGKRAAIKILLPALAADPDQVRRFIREAEVVNRINHPGVVDIFGFGELPDKRPYLIMEFLEGKSLESHLNARGNLGIDEALTLLEAMLIPLEVAHNAGIVHRDIKPDNIYLLENSEGRWPLKILDFGVAGLRVNSANSGPRITKQNEMVGTPYYMAPEQAGNPNKPIDADARADLYALGATFYQMLTGKVPHDGANVVALLTNKMTASPLPLSNHGVQVPDWLEMLISNLLQVAPEDRPQDVKTVRDAIQQNRQSASIDDEAKKLKDQATKLSQREAAVANRENAVAQREEAAIQLVGMLSQKEATLTRREEAAVKLVVTLSQRDATLVQRENDTVKLVGMLSQRDATLVQRENDLSIRNGKLILLTKELTQQSELQTQLAAELQKINEMLDLEKKTLDDENNQVIKQKNTLNEINATLEKRGKELEAEAKKLKDQVNNREAILNDRESIIARREFIMIDREASVINREKVMDQRETNDEQNGKQAVEELLEGNANDLTREKLQEIAKELYRRKIEVTEKEQKLKIRETRLNALDILRKAGRAGNDEAKNREFKKRDQLVRAKAKSTESKKMDSKGAKIPLTFEIYQGGQLVCKELIENIIKIGKLSSSHLRIEDESVSPMHAVIEVQGPNDIYLMHLGNPGRTQLNGQKINNAKLSDGDEIIVGQTRIVVHIGQPLQVA